MDKGLAGRELQPTPTVGVEIDRNRNRHIDEALQRRASHALICAD